MTEQALREHIDRLFVKLNNVIGHLYICDYINNPWKYRDEIPYKTDIDDAVLFAILSNSTHFRNYQWFSWKLLAIDLGNIFSNDKSSLKNLKNKIDLNLKNELKGRYNGVSNRISSVLEDNSALIKRFRTLRNKVYAHDDFLITKPSTPDFNECWKLVNDIKTVFNEIGKAENEEFSFNTFGFYIRRFDEIEAYYNAITNPKNKLEQMYLMRIVDHSYLRKKGLIQ